MSRTEGGWDPPPYLSQGDQSWLKQKAEVLNAIQIKSYLDLGNILLDIQTRFRNDDRTKGWFNTWLAEETFLSAPQAAKFIAIAKIARENHGLAKLTKTYTVGIVGEVARFPSKVRDEVINVLKDGRKVTLNEVRELRQQPQVRIEALNEEAGLLQNQVMAAAATSGMDSPTYKKLLDNYHRVVDQLESLKEETKTGDQKWGALVLSLRREARKAKAEVENVSQDPDFYQKRIQGKVQIDVHKSVDGLSQALDMLDRYRDQLNPKVLRRMMNDLEELNAKIQQTTDTAANKSTT